MPTLNRSGTGPVRISKSTQATSLWLYHAATRSVDQVIAKQRPLSLHVVIGDLSPMNMVTFPAPAGAPDSLVIG